MGTVPVFGSIVGAGNYILVSMDALGAVTVSIGNGAPNLADAVPMFADITGSGSFVSINATAAGYSLARDTYSSGMPVRVYAKVAGPGNAIWITDDTGFLDFSLGTVFGVRRSPLRMPQSVSSLVTFGDSITAGTAASTSANRWANKIAGALNASLNNAGISGTVLQNQNLSGGSPQANNGLSRYATDLTGANKKSMVIIAYGLNDARYTGAPATMNVANFITDYRTMLTGLINAGYLTTRIVIVTPHWFPDNGFSFGTAGFTGQTRAGYETYVKAARDLAHEFGCYLADTYSAMMAAGVSLIDPTDYVHPLDAGHEVIYRTVLGATLQVQDAYAYDNFTAADGTDFTTRNGPKNAAWTLAFGYSPGTPAPQIQGNKLYNTALSSVYSISGVPQSADYETIATLYCVTVTALQNIGIYARGRTTNVDDRYWFRYLEGTGWQLFKTVAGTATQLGSTVVSPIFTANQARRIMIRCQGTTISAWVDGSQIISVTDSAISAANFGGIRMATTITSGTGLQINDILVRPVTPQAS